MRQEVERHNKEVTLDGMIKEIENIDEMNLEFNERLFTLIVRQIKVHKNGEINFVLKDGEIIKILV